MEPEIQPISHTEMDVLQAALVTGAAANCISQRNEDAAADSMAERQVNVANLQSALAESQIRQHQAVIAMEQLRGDLAAALLPVSKS